MLCCESYIVLYTASNNWHLKALTIRAVLFTQVKNISSIRQIIKLFLKILSYFTFFLFFFFFTWTGTALRCWECDSSRNPDCEEPERVSDHFSSFNIRDCDQGFYPNTQPPVCKKIVTRGKSNKSIFVFYITLLLYESVLRDILSKFCI